MSAPFTETEQKILDAAKKVFLAKGMAGARMQEIANEAGINKSLLHYYFRTKEKLFEAIFQSALGAFFPSITTSMLSDATLEEKLKIFIQGYSKVLHDNPFLPSENPGDRHRPGQNQPKAKTGDNHQRSLSEIRLHRHQKCPVFPG